MERFSIAKNAEALADKMHELAVWSKAHPNSSKFKRGIFKLPPVFSSDKHGDPRKNLIAMIKTLADYEESDAAPKLAELPSRYNQYGGGPELNEKDLRKIHNWLQQVGFGIRAAMLINEMENPTESMSHLDVPERVFHMLFANHPRRTFVTYASDNKYELRPLRYADSKAKLRWLKEEFAQLNNKRVITAGGFGVRPTQQEWDTFGLRGQTKTALASVNSQIDNLVGQAKALDFEGKFTEADILDFKLNQLSKNLEGFDQVQI